MELVTSFRLEASPQTTPGQKTSSGKRSKLGASKTQLATLPQRGAMESIRTPTSQRTRALRLS